MEFLAQKEINFFVNLIFDDQSEKGPQNRKSTFCNLILGHHSFFKIRYNCRFLAYNVSRVSFSSVVKLCENFKNVAIVLFVVASDIVARIDVCANLFAAFTATFK